MTCLTRAVGFLAGLSLAGCSRSSAPAAITQAAVTESVTFATIVDAQAGISQGVDVDGRNHPNGDPQSCGQRSFTSPTGTPGIDNQLGTLLPMLQIGGQDIGDLMEQASHAGMILILIAIDGATDLSNDPSVSVRIAMGSGTPLFSANDGLLPYQTFGIDTSEVPVSTLPGRITGGVLEIGPGDATFRLRVLQVKFDLTLHEVVGQLTLTRDPLEGGVAMVGTIGGGIVVTDLQAIIDELGFDPTTQADAVAKVPSIADLAQSSAGRCTQVSAGLFVLGAPAFIIGD
jgi:hypothetical protein